MVKNTDLIETLDGPFTVRHEVFRGGSALHPGSFGTAPR